MPDPVTASITAIVVSATATGASIHAQRQGAKKQERLAKEANAVSRAQQQAQDITARRKAAKEERIRRAQISQAATNVGVSGSSGAAGAISAVATNTAGAGAAMHGQALAADALTSIKSDMATAASKTRNRVAAFQGIGNLATTSASLYNQAYNTKS